MGMRYPKWSPDGSKLLYEDGTGGIVLESGQESVTIRGNRPCWLNATRWLYTKNNVATFEFGNPDPIFPRELHELAAGGGNFAGVDRGVLFVRYANGSERRIPNAGQPCFDRDGELFYRDGDRFIEPTCLGELRAWKEEKRDGIAVVTSWGHRYEGEGWPKLIWTPQGAELLTMTNTAILIRKVGTAHEGYERFTGADKNLDPDGVYRNGAIHVACNSGILPPFKLSVKRGPFTGENGQTPEPEPMPDKFPLKLKSGANLHDFIEAELRETELVGKGANEQERRDNAARAIAIAAAKANAIEGREVYGLRSKHRGGWSRLALKAGGIIGTYSDLLAYRDPFLSVDCIGSAESSKAKPGGWTNEGRVRDSRHRFVAPSELILTGVEPQPEPEPEPGPGEPVPIPDVPSNLELRLQAIEREVKALKAPHKIALKADNGRYVCAEQNLPETPLVANRPGPGAWEQFTIERIP